MVPAVSGESAATFPLVRFPNPRRADARRSWLSVWQLPNNARFLRYSVGIAYPRRADARRSFWRAFVHRKSRFFSGNRSRSNSRAGGVSPPWVRYRYCTGVREHGAGSLRRVCGKVPASTFPEPTAG
jgi:hypothetical protein